MHHLYMSAPESTMAKRRRQVMPECRLVQFPSFAITEVLIQSFRFALSATVLMVVIVGLVLSPSGESPSIDELLGTYLMANEKQIASSLFQVFSRRVTINDICRVIP